VVTDAAARRVLVAGAAGLLFTAPVIAHDSLNGRLVIGWLLVLGGVVLGVVALDRRRQWGRRVALLCGAACAGFAISSVVILGTTLASSGGADLHCRDDVSAAAFGGADELRAGHDPYDTYGSLSVERGYGCGRPAVTILRRGRFADAPGIPSQVEQDDAVAAATGNPAAPEVEQRLEYPGGTVLLGLVGPRAFPFVMAVLLVAAMLLTVRRSVVDRRATAVALAAQAALLSLIPDGHTDAAVVALLLVAWGRPEGLLGGLALGLACGTKQTAWFFVPALLATAYVRGGRRGLGLSAAGTLAGFGVLNLPFAVMDAGAWAHGILGPALDGLFPLGAGPIGLVTSGVLSIAWAPLFTVLQLACTVAAVPIVLRLDRRYPGIGVLVGSLALFLGTRSLLEYIAGGGVLLVGAVATAPGESAAVAPAVLWSPSSS
jgi:hypothetical protein